MSDDFDIEKFLNDSFAKIEKKFDKKPTKKVEKVLNKYNKNCNVLGDRETSITQGQISLTNQSLLINTSIPHFKLNDYNFEKVISNKVLEELNLPGLNKNQNIKLETIIKPLFPNDKVYENEFRNADKSFILDKFVGNPIKKSDKEETNILNSNNNPSLKINKFKKVKESELISSLKKDNSITYLDLYSMHAIWKEYISNLLNKTTQEDTINSKMLKADLHGAIIEVVESTNKNLLRIKGINLLETRRTFNLLSEDNRIRTVLKKGSVFSVGLPYEDKKYLVRIIGDNFTYKAVERTKAKFKNKYNL